MQFQTRSLLPLAAIAISAAAHAQDPPFLEWNIQMTSSRLQSGPAVLLKNLKKPGKLLGCTSQATIDIAHAGINLVWWEHGPRGGITDVRFEIENPGKVTPGVGPISYASKVAIKVGSGGKFGGYLKCQDTRFGIDMNFAAQPSYEWHVITMAPEAEGISQNHKIALLNTKKKAFLVYQSRRIGFELGWWRYLPPAPVQSRVGNPAMLSYKSNHGEIVPFLNRMDTLNRNQSRFLRSFFGIRRYPG